jgi:hypothetical protein
VMVLIAVHGRPPWVEAIVYVTVVITVLSGVDYFFGSARPRVPSGVVADGAVSAGSVSSGGVEPGPPARVS